MNRRLQLLMPWCFYTIKTLLCGIVSESEPLSTLYLSVITVFLGRCIISVVSNFLYSPTAFRDDSLKC